MRLALLSTAAAAALLYASPVVLADADFTGVGQLYVGTAKTDGGFFGGKLLDDPFTFGGKAKGYWPLSPDVHLQVDLFAEQDEGIVKNFGPQDDASTLGGAAHLLHPFEDRARFGIAGSIWQTDVFTWVSDTPRHDATYGLLALDGQFFGTDWSGMVQGGGFTNFSCEGDGGEDGCTGAFEDGTFIRGRVRYFLSDNTVFSVETTQMWGTMLDDDGIFSGKTLTGDFSQWIIDAEHKFRESDFAASVALSHEHVSGEFGSATDTNGIMFSLKYYYGQPTLRANDRKGAEMDTPQFGNGLETFGAISFVP